MKAFRFLSAVAVAATLAACGNSAPPAGGGGGGGGGPAPGKLSCDEAFAGLDAGASIAAVDPRLPIGQPATLILAFTDDADMDEVLARLREGSALNAAALDQALTFRNLRQTYVPVPMVTPELVQALRTDLNGMPLVSIWADRPDQLLLETSTPVIGTDAVRDAFGITGTGIGVAVIDSGVDTTQGDFPNMVFNSKFDGVGYNVQTENSDTTSGHGTHVAGTVGGHGTASGGRFVGVAPGASLLGFGTGDAILVINAARGAAYDLILDDEFREQFNVRVTNNSFGPLGDPETGEAPPFDPADPFQQTIRRAYLKGVINVFAAGNDGPQERTLSPHAVNPCSIGVGMANREGGLAVNSSRGDPEDAQAVVDISAPGVFITSPRATGGVVTVPRPDFPDYSTISGTSMATPHVAGAVALMLEANPLLTVADVQRILRETAIPMRADAPIEDVQVVGQSYAPWEAGPGMLNVAGAVARVLAQPTPPLTVGRFELSPGGGSAVLGRWTGLGGFIVEVPGAGARLNPCLCGVFDRHYVVDVPALPSGSRLVARTELEVPGVNWRLRLFGPEPDGELLGEVLSGGETVLELAVDDPVPGTYRAVLSELTTEGGSLTMEMRVERP